MRAQKILFLLLLFDALLVIFIALKYSFNTLSALEAAAALLMLLTAAVVVGLPLVEQARPDGHRPNPRVEQVRNPPSPRSAAILFGLVVGLLWMVEIGINNFLAPPLPERNLIDNLFWAAVALLLLLGSLFAARQERRWRAGVAFGMWSGLASGAVACSMALVVIVFGMHYLLSDPLNLAEWATVSVNEPAPGMATYFAYQTLAGALLHLVGLGALMGVLLGAIGGGVVKIFDIMARGAR